MIYFYFDLLTFKLCCNELFSSRENCSENNQKCFRFLTELQVRICKRKKKFETSIW